MAIRNSSTLMLNEPSRTEFEPANDFTEDTGRNTQLSLVEDTRSLIAHNPRIDYKNMKIIDKRSFNATNQDSQHIKSTMHGYLHQDSQKRLAAGVKRTCFDGIRSSLYKAPIGDI